MGVSAGALMFDDSQPCRASESVDLPIDTTAVADGEHTLKVTVEDAAQNSSVVYDATHHDKERTGEHLRADDHRAEPGARRSGRLDATRRVVGAQRSGRHHLRL